MESINIQASFSNDDLTALMTAALVGFGVTFDQDQTLAKEMAKGIVTLRDALPKAFVQEHEKDRDMAMAVKIVRLFSED